MDQPGQPGQDGQKPFPPKKGGFPPQSDEGGDEDEEDPDLDIGDEDTDQEQDFGGDEAPDMDDEDVDSGDEDTEDAEEPDTDDSDEGDESDETDAVPAKPSFPPKKKVTEAELLEYGNMAAIESKIKMLHMQIASQGDPGGKRRAALRSLEDQLKARK
jgi:hypothetical protein